MTVENPCLSGGAIEFFLEPVLPEPRVVVVGETPVARRCGGSGSELGLERCGRPATRSSRSGDLALVVAAHGRDELRALRQGLEAGVPYVGLVASRKRGAGVIGELRGDGVSEELLARIDVPAGWSSAPARRPRSRWRSWRGSWRCGGGRPDSDRRGSDLRHDHRRRGEHALGRARWRNGLFLR